MRNPQLVLTREALYEDESFPDRELAALVASKIYYHLQEYNESMVFALGAGKLLDLDHPGEFEDTIIGASGVYDCGRACLVSYAGHLWNSKLIELLLSSQVHRHLHCTLCHAQPSGVKWYRGTATSAARLRVSFYGKRKRKHLSWTYLSYHSFLAVYLANEVPPRSPRLFVLIRTLGTWQRAY